MKTMKITGDQGTGKTLAAQMLFSRRCRDLGSEGALWVDESTEKTSYAGKSFHTVVLEGEVVPLSPRRLEEIMTRIAPEGVLITISNTEPTK